MTRSPPSASARTWSAPSATGVWRPACWRRVRTPGAPCGPASLGTLLLADDGLDPYLEDPATLWLLHWQIASNRARATTWFWTFSHFNEPEFTREALASALFKWTQTLRGKQVAESSVSRDVEVFLRTYVPSRQSRGDIAEDTLDCPLIELGLITQPGDGQAYRFRRGPQRGLPDGILLYAVLRFWQTFSAHGRDAGPARSRPPAGQSGPPVQDRRILAGGTSGRDRTGNRRASCPTARRRVCGSSTGGNGSTPAEALDRGVCRRRATGDERRSDFDRLIVVSPRFARSVSLARDANRSDALDGYILTPTGRDVLRRLAEALRARIADPGVVAHRSLRLRQVGLRPASPPKLLAGEQGVEAEGRAVSAAARCRPARSGYSGQAAPCEEGGPALPRAGDRIASAAGEGAGRQPCLVATLHRATWPSAADRRAAGTPGRTIRARPAPPSSGCLRRRTNTSNGSASSVRASC